MGQPRRAEPMLALALRIQVLQALRTPCCAACTRGRIFTRVFHRSQPELLSQDLYMASYPRDWISHIGATKSGSGSKACRSKGGRVQRGRLSKPADGGTHGPNGPGEHTTRSRIRFETSEGRLVGPVGWPHAWPTNTRSAVGEHANQPKTHISSKSTGQERNDTHLSQGSVSRLGGAPR